MILVARSAISNEEYVLFPSKYTWVVISLLVVAILSIVNMETSMIIDLDWLTRN